MKTTKTLLFLDDIRWPIEAFQYTKNEIFLEKEWSIVRNYQQFVDWIIENGLPKLISFDHDLADEHYWAQNTNVFVEKTGYDCAKWLVEYCLENHQNLPKFYCHSMNPVGKENILNLLNNFRKQLK